METLGYQVNVASVLEHAYNMDELKALGGGKMNCVFEAAGGRVIHAAPEPEFSQTAEAWACAPSLYPHKGARLQDMFSRLVIPPSPMIAVSTIDFSDTVFDSTRSYTVWAEDKLPGTMLHLAGGLKPHEYEGLIDWVASLQRQNTAAGTEPLKTYYDTRLMAFAEYFSNHTEIPPSIVSKALRFYRYAIDSSVASTEMTSFVHGDLNWNNVLVNRSESEPSVGVIDFERGVFGGDCLADPLKLLQIGHVFRKPDPDNAHTYINSLTDAQKLDLMERFGLARGWELSGMPNEQLFLRDTLVHVDTVLSILACRLAQQDCSEVEWHFLPAYLSDYLDQTRDQVQQRPASYRLTA